MRNTAFLPLLLLPLLGVFPGCATSEQRWERADASTRSEYLLRQHFAEHARMNRAFPLGNLGWHESTEVWSREPQLHAARQDFEKADAALKTILRQDSEYVANEQWFNSLPPGRRNNEDWKRRNAPVYRRLEETSAAYRAAREERERKLYLCNARTLDFLLAEARQQNRALPTEWIPADRRAEYIRRF